MKQKLMEALRKSNDRKLEGLWKQQKLAQVQARSSKQTKPVQA